LKSESSLAQLPYREVSIAGSTHYCENTSVSEYHTHSVIKIWHCSVLWKVTKDRMEANKAVKKSIILKVGSRNFRCFHTSQDKFCAYRARISFLDNSYW